jgi:poly(3-hydroxybutyrate) depolymerase
MRAVIVLAILAACRGPSPNGTGGEPGNNPAAATRASNTPEASGGATAATDAASGARASTGATGAASSTGATLPADAGKCPAGFERAISAGHHTGFASGGQARTFDMLLPDAAFTGPRPLVFAFHGTGLSGALAISDYGLSSWADAGAIVVAPDSNGNGAVWPVWDALYFSGPTLPNADLALFDDLLGCVAAHYAVDSTRVYALGHSAGGAMTHFMLAHRPAVLAGGIAASGMFDGTQASPVVPLGAMTVIVTWGGANDVYSGSAGSQAIANIGYAEQSALASQHYAAQAGTQQIACEGNDVGHAWLSPIEDWMRDVLLAHPKGSAPGWSLPPLPAGANASCSTAPATYEPPVTVACPASATAGCQAYCQLIGDCFAENGTLGPVVAAQLGDLGYANTANACLGCVSTCEGDATGSAPDASALSCFATHAPATACGPGFAGAAIFATVNECCTGSSAKVCARFCTAFATSTLFATTLTACP